MITNSAGVVRELHGEEMIEAIFNLGSYSFHPSPHLPGKEERLKTLRERKGFRYFGVLEDGQVVAGMLPDWMNWSPAGLRPSLIRPIFRNLSQVGVLTSGVWLVVGLSPSFIRRSKHEV